MKGYGQACPIARASALLSERWMPLVLRELLAGSRHFNDIHRGVPRMSRTLLSRRLRGLIDAGVLERSTDQGRECYELTSAGRELRPWIAYMARWGRRWVSAEQSGRPDPGWLMWDIRRGIEVGELPVREAAIVFEFDDVARAVRRWGLDIHGGQVDLERTVSGDDADLAVRCPCRTLTLVWFGEVEAEAAIRDAHITLHGDRALATAFPRWLGRSPYAS